MARCATPDVGHPILPELVDCDIDNIILGDPALFECLDDRCQDLPIVLIELQYSSPGVRDTEPGEQSGTIPPEMLPDFGVGARRYSEIGQFLATGDEEGIE
jgi:hypothetical protein